MAAISQKQLAQWYEAHGTDLMLYARQWNADQQAEDIVQDAFIRLLKQRKCPDNIRAWLFRVVRNCSISRTLPSNLREIVLLRIWGQMSLKQISQIVKKSIPWVHHDYREALEMIRKKLEHSSCKTKKI
ncbi:MAG: RNA polymerase sigma factor [Planctomycetota bacterium]|jgi:DNA-directed RNA polymerase specialized sigma24 family protein